MSIQTATSLPPAKSPAALAAGQLKKTGVTNLRKPRLKSLRDEAFSGFTGLIFGKSGSGKTEFFVQLMVGAKTPLRAIYVNTDIGAGGFATIKARLKTLNRLDLIDKIAVLDIGGHFDEKGNEISGYEEFYEFLKNPWDEEMMAFDPSLLFWDGFGSFQSIDVVDYVLDKGEVSGTSGPTDLRGENLVMEKVGKGESWEARKRATVRCVDKFCTLKRPDGKAIHKFMTMFEGSRQVPVDRDNPTAGSRQELTGLPLLSGFGVFDQIKGATDLVIKTAVKDKEGGKVKEYKYYTGGPQNVEGKVRALELDIEIAPDAAALFNALIDACDLEGK